MKCLRRQYHRGEPTNRLVASNLFLRFSLLGVVAVSAGVAGLHRVGQAADQQTFSVLKRHEAPIVRTSQYERETIFVTPRPSPRLTAPAQLPEDANRERLPQPGADLPSSRRSAVQEAIELQYTPIGQLTVGTAPSRLGGELPPDLASPLVGREAVTVGATSYYRQRPQWDAAVSHRPLYFEEANLERYGTSRGILQPAVSAARFFGTIPTLPYQVTVARPHVVYDFVYPYQAGRSAPSRVGELPPLNVRAGLVEAGTVLGLIFLIP